MLPAGMALVSRIDNVHIYVRDMKRSRAFYRDLLGLPLEGDEHWMQADLDGVRFALHASPEGVEPAPGTAFINFEVGDADAAAAQVRAAGHEPTEVMREDYGTSFEVVDPDGYRIHLFQPPS